MSFFPSMGPRFARVLTLSLCLTLPAPVVAEPLLAWRNATTISDLVETLDSWLDENTGLPRRQTAPHIQWIATDRAAALSNARFASQHGKTRGLYDPDTATIHLARPWNLKDPMDVSVLLHELVHHRQAGAGHWYCPGAQELPAYRMQDDWLRGLGLKADVNWIAVVLEAGCTPRDIHPD